MCSPSGYSRVPQSRQVKFNLPFIASNFFPTTHTCDVAKKIVTSSTSWCLKRDPFNFTVDWLLSWTRVLHFKWLGWHHDPHSSWFQFQGKCSSFLSNGTNSYVHIFFLFQKLLQKKVQLKEPLINCNVLKRLDQETEHINLNAQSNLPKKNFCCNYFANGLLSYRILWQCIKASEGKITKFSLHNI